MGAGTGFACMCVCVLLVHFGLNFLVSVCFVSLSLSHFVCASVCYFLLSVSEYLTFRIHSIWYFSISVDCQCRMYVCACVSMYVAAKKKDANK